ncbi:trascriptional regulator [Bacillus sp. FJAT-22090]|uniref:LCP family glycopolymer transferase n=1 Tax=Bacillus sp. FJAT-22090 TaxID=1581038 RepID=UPI0006ADC0C2|nr:LCP family protein [Bacillus sp. FJAT-22090]ALC86386.1 trascriptional regulator [Bacillus sp. FJAT-22090]
MFKKKVIWISLIICFLIGVVVYASSIYNDVTTTIQTIHEPEIRKVSELRTTEVELVKKEPFSLLLLGVDEREGDKGRSDTMIVLTVNPTTNSTKMISIPRDTYTEIIGKDKLDKINHAYAFGGIEMSLDTIENLLNIPVDYILQVNMESFLEIVDIIGGVNVDNPIAFQEGGYTFNEGIIHLDGEQALTYVRMRKDDPQGDFGRQARQKQVLQAILKEGATVNNLWKYKEFLASIQENIRTNMTFEQMIDIQKGYKNALNQIETLSFEKGEGTRIDGIWYYVMDEQELNNVTLQLKKHLEIE